MKIFVTGAAGQLGHDVINELALRNEKRPGCFEYIASDIGSVYSGVNDNTPVVHAPYISMDITDEKAVMDTLISLRPDAVIHCAAWTAVDLAEDADKQEQVYRINALGTKNIARAVRKLDQKLADGCKMMYISTDYVFNGQGTAPWEPDCKDYAPLNVYGRTKLEGEKAVADLLEKFFIVRIAWVFGKNGKNFIKTMLQAAKTHDRLKVVNDQIGTPTYTYDLAKLLTDMIASDKYGYYHATNSELLPADDAEASSGYTKDGTRLGYISWYDFTKEIFRQAVLLGHTEYTPEKVSVEPVTTEEYGLSKASRPFNSRLDKHKLENSGLTPLPTWQNALIRYLKEIDF